MTAAEHLDRTGRPGRRSGRSPLVGDVVEFDEPRGLGMVEYGPGRRLPFHCTAITDGSRRIAVGTVVAFGSAPAGSAASRPVGPSAARCGATGRQPDLDDETTGRTRSGPEPSTATGRPAVPAGRARRDGSRGRTRCPWPRTWCTVDAAPAATQEPSRPSPDPAGCPEPEPPVPSRSFGALGRRVDSVESTGRPEPAEPETVRRTDRRQLGRSARGLRPPRRRAGAGAGIARPVAPALVPDSTRPRSVSNGTSGVADTAPPSEPRRSRIRPRDRAPRPPTIASTWPSDDPSEPSGPEASSTEEPPRRTSGRRSPGRRRGPPPTWRTPVTPRVRPSAGDD